PPTASEQGGPPLGPAPQPSMNPSTNPLFIEAQQGIPAALPVSNPPEFATVLRPFSAQAFATGIPQSNAGIGPLAIVALADGSVLISGGANRGQLFHFSIEGGAAGIPSASLPYPIFTMALSPSGVLWATTGGGPL